MSTQHGYFLIADITGYTQYLSTSELDHAQQTLTALLNLLIGHTKPPLIISRLAGDAVISYALEDNFLQGQTFVELLEDTYVSFRRAVDLMVRNTTCPCNACRNIGSLDLKFFVHYGMFGVQKLDGHDELIGSDVNLIHRLLKNTVKEQTGIAAYTLYSSAAIQQLGLDEAAAQLVAHAESYEHLGAVQCWVQDMHAVWDRKHLAAQISIPARRVLETATIEVDVPREQLWDYLLQAEHFNAMLAATKVEIVGRVGGRIGTGTVYECYHGGGVAPQLVLEWQPFERMLFQFDAPVPVRGTRAMWELRLEPSGDGTRATQTFSKPTGPILGRFFATKMLRMLAAKVRSDMASFKTHIEAVHGRNQVTNAVAISSDTIAAAARESLATA